MIIEIFLNFVQFVIINLNNHVCIFEKMGVAAEKPHPIYDIAHRAPVLKLLEITTGFSENLIIT